MEKFIISGITSKIDESMVTIRDIPDKPGIAAKLFELLGGNKIYVNMIVQSTGKDNYASISFTVRRSDYKKAMELCENLNKEWKAGGVYTKQEIAIVSTVGVGMLSAYGVAGRIFQILSDHGINIEMISTSEIGISCVIDSMYAELAVKALHKNFIEAE